MTIPAIPAITINDHVIGTNRPAYIIAELSANHGQSYDRAVDLIHAAKKAGADAVKIQTYTPDTITLNSDSEYFRIGKGTLWSGQTLYDLYEKAYTPWEWQPGLQGVARKLNLDFFSSPFDKSAVDFLAEMDVPVYKIASFELVDIPLIQYAASKGKPLIMSTGMAALSEIEEAVSAARSAGCRQIALLKCVSAYPARPEEMNLRTIPDLSAKFLAPVGLSDHTMNPAAAIAAVALGACILEKHLTLSRLPAGPDSAFSLEPGEFKATVDAVRTAEKALGRIRYEVTEDEAGSRIFRRSLFVVEDVQAGEVFTSRNVRSIRPGNGLHTRYENEILGRRATRDIRRGTPLTWEMVSSAE
jgi:pseudaminic acid synthase